MQPWSPEIAVDEDAAQPLFARIASAVVRDIRRGRLRPGDVLPGSRTLALALGVHRNTVLAAFDALVSEGWLETESARVTRVARALPERASRRFSPSAPVREGIPDRPLFSLGEAPPLRERETPRGTIALYGGMPDLRLFPSEAFARAYRRVLKLERASVLDYGSPFGHPALRRALAKMLSSLRAVAADEHNVLGTRGSQQAVDLLARTLLGPGAVIAVESMGYAPAWEAFRATGATVEPIPVDRDGMNIDALASLCERTTVRAVYLTPHHQYPTTVTLTPARRMALLALAKRRRLAVIEDDYDHEFHFEGRSVLPLASADPDGSVVYVATLSKMLAPGLRTGFVVGPRALIEHLAARRTYCDRQGDLAVEAALAELLEDGEIPRHARKARMAYRERRDVFVDALRAKLGDRIAFDVPRGGMALWAKIPGARGADPLCERALAAGVLVQRTRGMCFDGRDRPWVRLGYAGHAPSALREAAKRLASVW
jgi:GntR family transcriptional regulator/MocR family aminotransferase